MSSSRESKVNRDDESRENKSARRALRRELIDRENLTEIKTPPGVLLEPFSAYASNAHKLGYSAQCGQLTSMFVGIDMATALADPNHLSFFTKGMSWEDLIKKFSVHADSSMEDREEEFKKKVGPFYLSHYRDWAHKVHASFTPPALNKPTLLLEAIALVAKAYRNGHDIHKVDLPSSYVPVMQVKSSTGYPFYTSQWAVECEFQDEVITPLDWGMRTADRMVETGDYSLLQSSPYTMFNRKTSRGVIANPTGGIKQTERPVQCSPLLERFVTIGFQKHIMNVQRNIDYSCGLHGSDYMTGPIAEAMSDYESCLEADYSAFDTAISGEAIDLMFELVFKPMFSTEDHPQMDAIKDHYLSPKLVTPQGVMSGGASLMSGSMLTNPLGMCWGHIAWTYFNLRMLEEGKEFSHRAFGYSDDLCVFLNKDVSEDFSRIVAEIGLTAHKGKQKFSTGDDRNTSFLGNVYSPRWRGGKRPFHRVLSKLIWRERLSHGGDYDGGVYTVNGLTTYEEESVKVLQRLDSLGCNSNFDETVRDVCDTFGITFKSLSRVFNDTTATPTVMAMRRLVDNGWDPGVPIEIDMTIISDSEVEELRNLIEQLRGCPKAERLIKDTLKKLRRMHKTKVKEESIAEALDTFVTTSNKSGNVPEGPCCHLSHAPTDLSRFYTVKTSHDDTLSVIEEGRKSVIGSRVLRELLHKLQEVAKSTEEWVECD